MEAWSHHSFLGRWAANSWSGLCKSHLEMRKERKEGCVYLWTARYWTPSHYQFTHPSLSKLVFSLFSKKHHKLFWQCRAKNRQIFVEWNEFLQSNFTLYTLWGSCMTFTEANCPYWAKSLHRKLSLVSINWSQYWPHHTANPLMRDTCFLLQRNSLIYIIENCLFHCVFPF